MAILLNMSINSNHQGQPMKYYQVNTANIPDSQAKLEPAQQSRCYLCDIPKQDYSLTRAFSELICRGCLNYEGPDRIEQLIAAAYQFKKRQTSPAVSATPQATSGNDNHNTQQSTRINASGLEQVNIRDNRTIAYNQPITTKQISLQPLDTNRANRLNSGLYVDRRNTNCDGSNPSTATSKTVKERPLQKPEQSPSGSPTHQIIWESQIVSPDQQGYSSSRNSLLTTICDTRPTKTATTSIVALKNHRNKLNVSECVPVTPTKNQTKNLKIPIELSRQNERHAFDTSSQVASNQEICSNKPFGFRTSSSPRLLEMQKTQSSSLSHQLQAPIDETVPNSNGQGHIKEAETQMSKEKVSAANTKHPAPVNMNYAMQHHHHHHHQRHQQQMLAATAFDPMQIIRTPSCGAVDHLMRLHQQQFPPIDNANLERELARLQGGQLVANGARRASQLDSLTDCNRNADSLQRFIQDPNAAALSLQLYAASSMSCCGSTYFVQPPPPPQHQQQSDHLAVGSLRSDGINRANVKQTTQAPSSSLYGPPYPYTMGPYITSSGALFCPPQYHPYHYHPHHPTSFQSTAYGNILSSTGGLTNPQCFSQQTGGFNNLVGGSEKTSSFNTSSASTSGSKLSRRLLGALESNPVKGDGCESRYIEQSSAEERKRARTPVVSQERTNHKPNDNDGDRNVDSEADTQRNGDRNIEILVTINDSEESRISNSLMIQEKDRESRDGDDRDQSEQHSTQTRDKQSLNMPTGSHSLDQSPSKSRGDLNYRPDPSNSPPPAKRPATDCTRASRSLTKDDLPNNVGSNHLPVPPPPSQSIVSASSSLMLPANISKTKPQTTNVNKQQPTSRRSQGSVGNERSKVTEPTNKMKHSNGLAGQESDGLRQLRKALDLGSSPKAGHEMDARNGSMQTSSNNTNSASYHNENSSDSNFSGLNSEPTTPVSITSTSSFASRNSVGQQQSKQTQQTLQQQLQAPSHKYSPIKCLPCQAHLEDRHFVQCPSVMAHKFCFACSKKSIERQQLENKNLGNGFDRVFCPSGRRCFLATEQTPWTFMNSEIETIFRESSRVCSSASGEAPNSRVNSGASPQVKSKHGRADDEFEKGDKLNRSSSRLQTQSEPEEPTDSSSQEVGPMTTPKANKVN